MPQFKKNGITYGQTKKVTYFFILVMSKHTKFNNESYNLKKFKKQHGLTIVTSKYKLPLIL